MDQPKLTFSQDGGDVQTHLGYLNGQNAFSIMQDFHDDLKFCTNSTERMTIKGNGIIGIGTVNPDISAILEVNSTDKGFLPPRVADTNAITNPVEGLHIYDLSSHCMRYFNGTLWSDCIGSFTPVSPVPTVHNPTTGKTWMDRNLGASQVATSKLDAAAYGDFYQWGRAADGHESRTSNLTSTNATTAVPNGGNAWDGKFRTPDLTETILSRFSGFQ